MATRARAQRQSPFRIRLPAPRSEGSVRLDDARARSRVGEQLEMPPFLRWREFRDQFVWDQGQHVTLVGGTGSGKTTLARAILPMRDFTIVLATKRRDSSLYDPLRKMGFEVQETLDLDYARFPKIIFQPQMRTPNAKGLEEQKDAFEEALIEIFNEGSWCIYADEVRYLTDNLKLRSVFDVLWLQGRSLGISLVVSTQRPVSIPLLAFDQATHFFCWRQTLKDDIQRISEFAGIAGETVRYVLPRLPKHEALYINTQTGQLVRTNIRS
jgi:energy-coupling factor transporter ATP-binding protein EcfA2